MRRAPIFAGSYRLGSRLSNQAANRRNEANGGKPNDSSARGADRIEDG